MDIKIQAVEGIKWSGLQQWGGKIISLLVVAILAHYLEPEAFGLVAMALIYVEFVQVFIEQGFGAAIVQRSTLEQEHLNTAFWLSLISGIFLTVISISISGWVANLFRQSQLEPIIKWLSISLLLGGMANIQYAILRRHLEFKKISICSLIASIAGGVVGVTMAIMQYGVWSLVAQYLVSSLVRCLTLWRVSTWRPKFQFSRKHLNDLFSFGLNIMGMSLLNFFNRHGGDLLIGYFLGPTLLGFYTIAYQLLTKVIDLLVSVGNAVAFPTYSRLQNDHKMISLAFNKSIFYMSLISFPIFVIVGMIASELVPIVYGQQWEASIPVLQVLVLIGILHSILYFHESVILAMGKSNWRLGMTLINAVTNVAFFLIAVRWGIVAIAAAYVIRGLLTTPIEIWMVWKVGVITIKDYFSQFIVPVIGSIVVILVIAGLRFLLHDLISEKYQIIIFVISAIIAYVITARLIMPSLRFQIVTILRYFLPEKFWILNPKHE